MKKTREQIIDSMCLTWRHDFGLIRSPENKFSGMTIQEREFLYKQMSQVFDNVISKILKELQQENKNLEDYVLKLSLNKNYLGECKSSSHNNPISEKLKNLSSSCSQIKNSVNSVYDVLSFKNKNKDEYKQCFKSKAEVPSDFKQLQVGVRFLHKPNTYLKDLIESVIEEWSPSKNYIKLKNVGWIEFDQFSKYNIVEILGCQEK